MRRADGLVVGVVGATGMVGLELLSQLEKRRFPIATLVPFSSGKTRKTVRFRGRPLPAGGVDKNLLAACDLVFFVSSDDVSLALAPELARLGVWCIDDSAAFRLDPAVPLIIPEVNASALRQNQRLIAGPNCTMTGLAVAARPLHRAAGVTEVRLASYQAVSGAGKAALEEFYSQMRAQLPRLKGGGAAAVLPPLRADALPASIAYNVIPQVGRFDAAGHSSEEGKVAAELRKVWGAPKMKVSVTAVRVPVVRGHSLAAWITLRRPMTPRAAARLLAGAPGLRFQRSGYPTPLSAGGRTRSSRRGCGKASTKESSSFGSSPIISPKAPPSTASRSPRNCAAAAGCGSASLSREGIFQSISSRAASGPFFRRERD